MLQNSEALTRNYSNAKPFPHIISDNFLPDIVAEKILSDFPERENPSWLSLPTEDQKNKLYMTDLEAFPDSIHHLLNELNSGIFIKLLEKITNIKELITDPKFTGGGLHDISTGGNI